MVSKSSSIGLYLHVPFCSKRCPYCAFYKLIWSESDEHRFVDAADRELHAYFEKYGRLSVHSIFWGGGTPSTLSDDAIDTLSKSIRRYCRLSSALEWTVEANPESLTSHRLSVFAAAGVNRVSVGIQSFLTAELELLGRAHTAQGIPGVLDRIRRAGIGNINMDFIYGLPGQTVDDLDKSLRIALDLGPTHLSAYALSIEPGTVYAKTGVVTANDDIQLRMYREIRRQLLAAGYQQYEVSAFAKPGFRSRHNMTYWRYSSYIGLGPSASSYFDGMAYQQVSSLDRYCQTPVPPVIRNRVEMSPEDLAAHFLIANLRRSEGVTYRHISSVFGAVKWGIDDVRIRQFKDQRLLCNRTDRLKLTRRGVELMNVVLEGLI